MDNSRRLRDAVRRLDQAVERRDWAMAGVADRALGRLLESLIGVELNAADRTALDAARLAHARARQRCEDASAQLEANLVRMRANKEGWTAYAMNRDPQENLS